MGCRGLALVVSWLLCLNGILSKENSYDPMVAFVCDKGVMHMDPNEGWYQDPYTDCIEDKEKILDYCKRVYPSLDVTNIVETLEHAVIKGWCPLGDSQCDFPQKYTVRPYRCLTGPFQSDALIVPHGCVFDHAHDAQQCQSYDWWGEKAITSCRNLHRMDASSFAMLLPCGTDVFTGVEYVCCPSVADAADSAEKFDVDKPVIEVKVSSHDEGEQNMYSVIQRYIQMTSESFDNEHDAYELAKTTLLKDGHDKITKLMKEWSEARSAVLAMKSSDGDGAERMSSEIMERYQKQYSSLQVEADSKMLQLDAVHQQHVQTNFNYKKKKSMQKLMDELQAAYYDVEEIISSLQKYISIEEKDARHCMKHLLRIKAQDPQAAADMLPATLEHLSLISLRINQSVGLLDTLRDEVVVEKMKESIRSWLDRTFFSVDKIITQLQSLTFTPKTAPVTSGLPLGEDVGLEILPSEDSEPMNMYAKYAEKLKAESGFMTDTDGPEDIATLEEEEEPEDERKDKSLEKGAPGVDHLQFSSVDAQQQNLSDNSSPLTGVSASIAIAITCSLICAVFVVVVAILLVKKRSRRSGSMNKDYLKVSADLPDMTPEDRHVAAMQNGYENPTYKLLEQRKV